MCAVHSVTVEFRTRSIVFLECYSQGVPNAESLFEGMDIEPGSYINCKPELISWSLQKMACFMGYMIHV